MAPVAPVRQRLLHRLELRRLWRLSHLSLRRRHRPTIRQTNLDGHPEGAASAQRVRHLQERPRLRRRARFPVAGP